MWVRYLSLLVFVAAISPACAQTDADSQRCHNQQSTMEIVDCLGRLTAQADRHLNAAYQKALKGVDPSGVPALRAAERAWLEFRKQRCFYLAAGPGTIGHVVGADCFFEMTRQRADELDADSVGLAGPG